MLHRRTRRASWKVVKESWLGTFKNAEFREVEVVSLRRGLFATRGLRTRELQGRIDDLGNVDSDSDAEGTVGLRRATPSVDNDRPKNEKRDGDQGKTNSESD